MAIEELSRCRPIKAWYVIMLIILTLAACSDFVYEVSQKRFMQMVKDREIERVTIINDHVVEVSLTPEALASVKYRSLLANKNQPEKGNPLFEIKIASERAFRTDLAKMNPTFPITTGKRSGLFD